MYLAKRGVSPIFSGNLGLILCVWLSPNSLVPTLGYVGSSKSFHILHLADASKFDMQTWISTWKGKMERKPSAK